MNRLVTFAASALFMPLALAADPATTFSTPSESDGADSSTSASSQFERADENGDGSLTSTEATAIGVSAEQFKAMDLNVDSVLSEAEYVAVVNMPSKSNGGRLER